MAATLLPAPPRATEQRIKVLGGMPMTLNPRRVLTALALMLSVASVAAAQDARFIVKFRTGQSTAGQAALRSAGAQVVLTLGPQEAVAAHIPAAALQALARSGSIEYLEIDQVREPFAWSNISDGAETLPYGIQMVQANLIEAPLASQRRICIIDSGYSEQHADLRDDTGEDLTQQANDSGSGSWNKDSYGHGTHVAGTVAAISGNGLGVIGANPDVRLHIVKVFGDDNLVEDGSGTWTYSSTLVAALNSCRTAGSNIVSMSLGGNVRSRTEEAAFRDADTAGVLSIAAAGNAGNGSTSFPAGYASVMSVAAVDANEDHASFSQRNRDVEISAPGVSVLSTTPYVDANTLTADGLTWHGGRIEGAPRTTGVAGSLVDGGQCTTAGAWTGLVVLCQRGDNTFADKVANVQAGGGLAAAIYNIAASDPTCGVFTGTLGRRVKTTIPAIALSCADGAAALTHAGSAGTITSAFLAPDSGYESWDGTSMATPHVSAVAALVWSCHLGWTNHEVREGLNQSAKDKGAAGRDGSFGYGIVQAKNFLDTFGWGACSAK
jgi:subtilisin family serine protease